MCPACLQDLRSLIAEPTEQATSVKMVFHVCLPRMVAGLSINRSHSLGPNKHIRSKIPFARRPIRSEASTTSERDQSAMLLHYCPLQKCHKSSLRDQPQAPQLQRPERRAQRQPLRVSSGPAMKPVGTVTSSPSASTTPLPATVSTPAAYSPPSPGTRGYRVSLFGEPS